MADPALRTTSGNLRGSALLSAGPCILRLNPDLVYDFHAAGMQCRDLNRHLALLFSADSAGQSDGSSSDLSIQIGLPQI